MPVGKIILESLWLQKSPGIHQTLVSGPFRLPLGIQQIFSFKNLFGIWHRNDLILETNSFYDSPVLFYILLQ